MIKEPDGNTKTQNHALFLNSTAWSKKNVKTHKIPFN